MAGTALDAREREEIRVGLEAEASFTVIANGLLQATSTISREVSIVVPARFNHVRLGVPQLEARDVVDRGRS